MSNTGSTQPPVTTSTTTSSPWAGVQPYLGLMYSGASALQQAGNTAIPYSGPTQAPLDPNVSGGLENLRGLSDIQTPGSMPNQYFLSQVGGLGTINAAASNYGLTPQMQQAIGGLGQAAGQYGNVYSQAQGGTNPYLLAAIADANQRGNAAIQSSMSAAGRYGSGQYQDVMARAQAQVADPLLMQDYEARQNRALQATQGLGQTYGQQAGIEQQGLGQAMQAYGQVMPAMYQAALAPSQNQLAAGQYMQNYQQQVLQGQIQEYNALQNYPWDQLARESAILSGAGSLGGTQVTAQTPLQASLASRLAGGALVGGGLGSTIGGPLGAAGGAGLGALAGAFL